jgi:isoleucyl-tRNA synthetase
MQAIQNFCSEDLGGFYLDILKDRLYTAGAKSPPRRAAQTALHHILQTLTRLIAPVLSFTAEEIWHTLNTGAGESVFLHGYYALPVVRDAEALQARWARLREIRALALKGIEDQRTAGTIGSSLQGELEFTASGTDYDLLAKLENDLRFVMITSTASVQKSAGTESVAVIVKPSTQQKCERCWHYRSDVGSNADRPTICGRCVSNLFGEGEKRFYA